ncbi:MAG TPA: hypothetical protein VI542_04335, partial [Candidatus Tectomicrobia bacterium]
DLQASVDRFRRAATEEMQTQYWAERRSIPREEHAQLEERYQQQERLTQKICEAMGGYVQDGVTPMAEAVMARVPEWERVQGQGVRQPAEEKQLTPTQAQAPEVVVGAHVAIETAPTTQPEQLSWREQWRERHGITTPSRRTDYRRDTQETLTQEQTHAQSY